MKQLTGLLAIGVIVAVIALAGLQSLTETLPGVEAAKAREAQARAQLVEAQTAIDAREYDARARATSMALVLAALGAGVGLAVLGVGLAVGAVRWLNLRAQLLSPDRHTALYPGVMLGGQPVTYNERAAQIVAAMPKRPTAAVMGRLLAPQVEAPPPPAPALPAPEILLPDRVSLSAWHPGHDLALPVGVGPGGRVIDIPLRGDLALITAAGLPGSGKTSLLRSFAHSIAAQSPGGDRAQLVICDPKRCEFSTLASGIPWMWRPVARDPEATGRVLHDLRGELDHRLRMMEKARVATYQGLGWPIIVILIDELSILARDRAVMDDITRISTLGRSAGLVVVAATQTPRASVMTPQLRALSDVNVSFRMRDVNESRLALCGFDGAETIPASAKGRAIVKRDTLTMVQTYLSPPMPTLGTVPADDLDDDQVEDDDDQVEACDVDDQEPAYVAQAREMFTQGASRRQIEIALFKYPGGAATQRVNEALRGLTRS